MLGPIPRHRRAAGSRRSDIPRRLRRTFPDTEGLDGRILPSITALNLSASPVILSPISPRNQPHAVTLQHILPVTIAGMVTSDGGVPVLRYQVYDEYGRDQPGGSLTTQPIEGGRAMYSLRIGLSAQRDPHFPAGRRYVVVVTAQDQGASRQASTNVTVPRVGFFIHTSPERTFAVRR